MGGAGAATLSVTGDALGAITGMAGASLVDNEDCEK